MSELCDTCLELVCECGDAPRLNHKPMPRNVSWHLATCGVLDERGGVELDADTLLTVEAGNIVLFDRTVPSRKISIDAKRLILLLKEALVEAAKHEPEREEIPF